MEEVGSSQLRASKIASMAITISVLRADIISCSRKRGVAICKGPVLYDPIGILLLIF